MQLPEVKEVGLKLERSEAEQIAVKSGASWREVATHLNILAAKVASQIH